MKHGSRLLSFLHESYTIGLTTNDLNTQNLLRNVFENISRRWIEDLKLYYESSLDTEWEKVDCGCKSKLDLSN